jgi:hypothetical protein
MPVESNGTLGIPSITGRPTVVILDHCGFRPMFSINVVSFSRNVVLRGLLFSLNSVPKPRMLSVRTVYVLSSYEADIVKPLMYFFSCSGCHGLADPAGASLKRKIPRGSGNRVPRFRLTKKTNNNTPFKINAKLDASIFSRTVLKERFPPEA